jgi:hypothetical protein
VERDRDEHGRARSARPRDHLGRPLPYGEAGTERQPEGIARTPAQTLAEGQTLLDEGKPFHAHEVFEDAWKNAPESEQHLWKGLAQIAVGLTHAARGNLVGGARLLRRGALYLAAYHGSRPHGIAVDALLVWAEANARFLEGATGGTIFLTPPQLQG